MAPRALETPNNIGERARIRKILATSNLSSGPNPGATRTLIDSAKIAKTAAATAIVITAAEITEFAYSYDFLRSEWNNSVNIGTNAAAIPLAINILNKRSGNKKAAL